MQRSSRKMADVTDKLLLLAHAEATPSTLLTHRVDLAAVVSSVLEETIVLAQRRDIDLGADLGERLDVAGSDSLLTALVMNLVDNAVRYTQPGGCVTVCGRRDGDAIVLDVVDNGPGIPAEARPHVFKRFYRVSADTEGSGLGPRSSAKSRRRTAAACRSRRGRQSRYRRNRTAARLRMKRRPS